MGPAACLIGYDTSQTMSAVILREDFPFLLVACSVADEAQGRIVGGEVEDRANNKAKTASQVAALLGSIVSLIVGFAVCPMG